MENPTNVADKQKTPDTSGNIQALQVVTGVSPAPTVIGPPTATLTQATHLPRAVGPMADPPRHSTSSDTSAEEISPARLGAIQQIVSAAIREQVAALAPARIATPSDVGAPEEEPGEAVPIPAPPTVRRLDIPSSIPQEFPAHWLARLECL
ncbi:UNVERIFIED_CONTAM: hypothetical protein Slati_0943800 [Sesamum latifolium]|uniref:Uncharacterized protein n=1 Tax=Sesamum latifolium TaxID=2727402 RepID=A0AAW2XTI5_9LAMI